MRTTPADRTIKPPPYHNSSTGKVDVHMDLQADKKVTATAAWTDEVGNATATPADASVVFTVTDPTIIDLTDNGDGTCVVSATGTLGSATVHMEATSAGKTVSGDALVTVVAGLAERVNITFGEPEEVTPDEGVEPGPEA
jgi:hypothetical protein